MCLLCKLDKQMSVHEFIEFVPSILWEFYTDIEKLMASRGENTEQKVAIHNLFTLLDEWYCKKIEAEAQASGTYGPAVKELINEHIGKKISEKLMQALPAKFLN